MDIQNLKIILKEDRYVIVDKVTEKIIDDAQGYGYKTREKASKAMWWKFRGGKENSDNKKKLFNEWIKIDLNKEIYNSFNNLLEGYFKEISMGISTIDEVFETIESEYGVEIPNDIKKYIQKN